MVEFVSADATLQDHGNKAFLVGIALEIENGSDFDDYYFSEMRKFCGEYDLNPAFPIVKSEYLLNNIPSYKIREASEDLAKRVLQNPAIRRVHAVIGWFDKADVEVGEKSETMSGIRFMKSHLQQYFPIITLWDYHRTHESFGEVPDEGWVDSVQGRITKAWSYVGNEFDMKIVPHGDITYPSLSTADYLAGHLARTLPKAKNLDELEDSAAGWLIEYSLDDDDVYVHANSVNQEDEEYIVPDYPYTIKGEQHYPHPVLFIHSDMFGNRDADVLAKTDFHAFSRQWGHENAGCVVNLRADRLPAIAESGDRIVFTSDGVPQECSLLKELNPTRDIDLMTKEGLMEKYLSNK